MVMFSWLSAKASCAANAAPIAKTEPMNQTFQRAEVSLVPMALVVAWACFGI